MKAEEKYKGSLKLTVIGDALGWMTEFEKSKDSLNKKFEMDYITSFHDWKKRAGGRFFGFTDKVKLGSYSDDTQLLLSVARSIEPDGLVDQEYFATKELPDWLLYSRGAGRTIKNAAERLFKVKSSEWYKNFFQDYRECGANGAAMRILPIALANFGDSDKIKKEIFKNSIITHGHPRAILGAMLYGYAINTILSLHPDNFSYKDFLTELGKDIHQKFSIDFLDNLGRLNEWEGKWNKKSKEPFRTKFGLIQSETCRYLQIVYKSITNNVPDSDVLKKLGCYEEKTKGSGTSTVIAGVYLACKYSKTPLYGIEQAVNSIGTKTNCIAAFAGGLLGALHGEELIIPAELQAVQDFDYIDKVSKRLFEIHENRVEKIERPDTDDTTSPGSLFLVKINEKGIKSVSEIEDDSFKVGDKVFLETLGEGKIKTINRQVTLDEDRYNLIFDVQFEIGQSCRFVRRLSLKHDYKKLQNEIGLKMDYKKFQDEIEKRAIEYLIHFTSTHNLSYILKDKKLMSVEKLKDSGRIKDVLINDEKRLEDLKNYINLSLSGPNTEMFRTKRRDYKNRSWCVLKIDPKHIYDRETMFSYYNAANTRKLQNGISGDLSQFKKLFKKELHTTNSYGILKVMTRDSQRLPKYPTCVQAEILVKDSIPLESILEVCFESKEKLAEAKTLMCSHDTSNFLIDNEIFSPNRYRL